MQASVNTHWNIEQARAERLVSPSALARWMTEHGMLEAGTRLGERKLQRAVDLREGLRALLFANSGAPADRDAIERLNATLASPGVFVQFDQIGQPHFAAMRPDFNAALATHATIVVGAHLDGSWPRLKVCPGDHCGWAFYDHSRIQANSWCAMSLCGSRAKACDYRQRKRLGRSI